MSFALKPGKSIGRQLKRVAADELDRASRRMLDAHRSDRDVHESRKSVKKVEALTKLLEESGDPPRRKDLQRLRAARRTLSKLRDAAAIIGTFERLRSRFSHRIRLDVSKAILQELKRRKSNMTRRARSATGSFKRTGDTLRKVRRSAKDWRASVDLDDVPRVLRRSFKVSRAAMTRAQERGRAPDFHEWRKRVKDLWYQLRLTERFVSGSSRQITEFKELETALGEVQNLAVFRNRLRRMRGLRKFTRQIDELSAMSTALQEELRRSALVLGTRLYRRSPKAFASEVRRRLRPEGTPRRRPSADTRGRAVA